jgi:hypothetical protein
LLWQAYLVISVICKSYKITIDEAERCGCFRSCYQLTTRYSARISQAFGGYAAGSGAAGLIGSLFYTLFTVSFGARPSAVLSAVGLAPIVMLVVYFCILPSPDAVEAEARGGDSEDEYPDASVIGSLKLADKLRLVKPMIWGYMAPLAIMMFLENVMTQVCDPPGLRRERRS